MKRVMLFVGLTSLCLLAQGRAGAATTVWMDAAEMDRYGNTFDGFAAVRSVVDNRLGTEDLTNVRFQVAIHAGELGGIGGWLWTNPDNPWYGAIKMEFSPVSEKFVEYSGPGLHSAGGWWGPAYLRRYLEGHALYVPPPDFMIIALGNAWNNVAGYPRPEDWLSHPLASVWAAMADERVTPDQWSILNDLVTPVAMDIDVWHEEHSTVELRDTVPAGFAWDICIKIIGLDGGQIELFSTAEGQAASDQGAWSVYDDDPTPQTIPEPGAISLIALGGAAIVLRKNHKPTAITME